MKIIIFTLALIFCSLAKISAATTDELINRIDEVKNDVRTTLDHIRSIRSTIPKLSEKILKITESNNFVVQTKEKLQEYEGKGESVKKCEALFNANYNSIVDQLYAQVSGKVHRDLSNIAITLQAKNYRLRNLEKQLKTLSETSSAIEDEITKEIDESSKAVDRYEEILSTIMEKVLENVEHFLFPALLKVMQFNPVYKPLSDCLRKIENQ